MDSLLQSVSLVKYLIRILLVVRNLESGARDQNYFRHYPVAARALDSGLEVTEIGSGSVCQDLCFRSFRGLQVAWTAVGLLTLAVSLALGLYHWNSPLETQEVMTRNSFYWCLLELGPPLSFFVSLVLLLIPALGFFGSYKENTWLLILFALLMIMNSVIKGLNPPKNPFLGFSCTLFLLLVPFFLAVSLGRRMSRAI